MKNFRIPLLIVIGLSFALGISWGIQLHRAQQEELGIAQQAATVRILAYKGLITPDILKEFRQQSSVAVQLTEVSTPEELWDVLEQTQPENTPDLVTLFSYQIPLATQLGRIQPVALNRLANFQLLSPDFTQLPGDRSLSRAVPLLWGASGLLLNKKQMPEDPTAWPSSWSDVLNSARLKGKVGLLPSTADFLRLAAPTAEPKEKASETDLSKATKSWLSHAKLSESFISPASLVQRPPSTRGQGHDVETPSVLMISHGETAFPPFARGDWKFVLPEEKATFWILSLVLTREAQSENEVYALIDFLLKKENALKLVTNYRQASTNRSLEEEEIDPRLKPSYLREFRLDQLLLLQDFSRAREMRALLSGQPVIEPASKESQSEKKPEKKSEKKPETKPAPKSEATPKPKPEPTPKPRPKPKPKPAPEARPEENSETGSPSDAGMDGGLEQPSSHPETQPESPPEEAEESLTSPEASTSP